MRLSTNSRFFLSSVLAGLLLVMGSAGYDRWQRDQRQLPSSIQALHRDIWLSDQLQLASLPRLKAQGILTIVDLRPDGEAADQPPSSAVEAAARDLQIKFVYVPVPHGEIPATVVVALSETLASSDGPVLLYCRSGKRAARTWALAEASRPGGLTEQEIRAAVGRVGQSVDDLAGVIAKRIAQRGKQ